MRYVPTVTIGLNWWIPTVAVCLKWLFGFYFVNFGPFDLIFDPLFGENCLSRLLLVFGR